MSWVRTGRKVMSGVRVEVVDYSKMEDDGGISINISLLEDLGATRPSF